MLGDSFQVDSGVRQGGVLSPYLLALYVDDLINNAKDSGFGIHIESSFLAVYFMRIISFYCLVVFLVNICECYAQNVQK